MHALAVRTESMLCHFCAATDEIQLKLWFYSVKHKEWRNQFKKLTVVRFAMTPLLVWICVFSVSQYY